MPAGAGDAFAFALPHRARRGVSNRVNAREPMSTKDPVNWMLSEAIDSLARAERLRQQFFSLQSRAGSREPSWDPPIDVLETDREILILVALPGVDPEHVEAVIENGTLVVSGQRVLPVELRNARIHRLWVAPGAVAQA